MEPPPPPLSSTAVSSTVAPTTTASIPPPHPESLDSSPKSRATDACDDHDAPSADSSKLRLMCSYNGHILPRPHDKSLCYMGGDTRIVVVERNLSLSSLISRLSTTLLNNRSFTLKYQLPTEDLDSLISVTTDEDLDNMIEEYDRMISSAKPSRLRLFLFTAKPEATQSMSQILESSAKSDDWFLDALNRGFSESDSDVNRLLGLDGTLRSIVKDDDDGNEQQQRIKHPPPQQAGQDVHNLPDSPMLDTSSSFGSTSSSPSLANLPPIRIRVEEGVGVKGMHDQKLGIEEHLGRINVGNKHQQEEGFAAMSSPPPMPVTISLPAVPVNGTTLSTGIFLDDDRYIKPPTSQPQNLPTQQVKANSGGHEMPSPNSVSSDNSLNNPVYQEPVGSNVVAGLINPLDPNTLVAQNQNQDSGFILHPQQSAQSQPQQQQFIHATAPQYLHHHPSTGLPVQTYIQVYPSQQQPSFQRQAGQLDQQAYPFYYVTAPVPPNPYGMPITQSGSVSESLGSQPFTMMAPPPNNHLRNTPGGQPEAGVYTTPQGMGGAQMVHQIPISQQQFMGYSQIHHPPQSGSAGIPSYGYEYAENGHKQVYYAQPGHIQYQTMTGPPPPAMVLPDGSAAAKLPAENMTQPIRTSQPL